MLRLVAIAAFIFAANLNLFTQQDTSGWVQEGNVWLNKQEIGTIKQAGLSSTGDSIWTYSDDDGYYFRIWELKSGLMVYEKNLVTKPYKWPYIAIDMKSVIYLINPAEFEIYDLQTDTLIKAYDLYDISREKVAPEVRIDFNASRREVYYAQKRGYISQGFSQSSMSMQVYVINEGVQSGGVFGPNFVYNNDFSKMAGLNFSHKDITYGKTEYSHSVSYYDIERRLSVKLYEVKNDVGSTYRSYRNLVFTSNPNLLAGFDSKSKLTIWDLKSNEIISDSELLNFDLGNVCFTRNDEYIVGVKENKIHLYELASKSIINSTVEISNNNNIKLTYSPSQHYIVFFTDTKFGLLDSENFITSVDDNPEPNLSQSILPAPNPAENSVTLQFAEEQIVRKVQVYDYSGIEVMQFTYPQSPVYEVQLPLHKLNIGMYHVTVTTDSGILRTKFIKY